MTDSVDSFKDRNDVAHRLALIADASAESFDSNTLTNGEQFVELARSLCRLPDEVTPGYWPTFNLSWGHFTVEVFKDHLETYLFKLGETDIAHFQREPDQPFPGDFVELLTQRAGVTP